MAKRKRGIKGINAKTVAVPKSCSQTKSSAARRELVAQTYQERNSSRSVARIFAISHRMMLNGL
jgi:hypothetical protein